MKLLPIFTFLALLFNTILLNSSDWVNNSILDVEKLCRTYPGYQDIIVKNQVVKKGSQLCGPRYELIRPILEKYNRTFSLLDIGAMEGYFSFRAAEDYGAICTMIEGGSNDDKSKLYWYGQEKLYSLCHLNSHLKNIDFLAHRLTLSSLKDLNKAEHFDVVLVFLVLHFMAKDPSGEIPIANLRKFLDVILQLGNDVIVEMSVDVYPELDEYVHKYCLTRGGVYIGELPRVWTNDSRLKGRFYWFQNQNGRDSKDATKISPDTFTQFNGVFSS